MCGFGSLFIQDSMQKHKILKIFLALWVFPFLGDTQKTFTENIDTLRGLVMNIIKANRTHPQKDMQY